MKVLTDSLIQKHICAARVADVAKACPVLPKSETYAPRPKPAKLGQHYKNVCFPSPTQIWDMGKSIGKWFYFYKSALAGVKYTIHIKFWEINRENTDKIELFL